MADVSVCRKANLVWKIFWKTIFHGWKQWNENDENIEFTEKIDAKIQKPMQNAKTF